MTLPRLGLFLAALIAAAIVADYAVLLSGATAGDLHDLATDAYLRRVIGFTFLQATLSALIALGAAIPATRALARQSDFPGRNLILQFCALPMVMPFILLALLFRVIENFKMFDLVDQLTSGGPGSVTELASIHLKREAFEKWRTGYASALAIILFVSIYGLSLVAVRFLDKVKQR